MLRCAELEERMPFVDHAHDFRHGHPAKVHDLLLGS